MKNKETSWGAVADWYDNHLSENPDSYHQKVVLPNLLRLMDIKSTDNVLDLACGTGFFARHFSALSKNIIGADISKELVDIAKKNSDPIIKYIVTPADNLKQIPDNSIDKISLVLAIQNINEVKEMLYECHRILSSGGSMHIVLNHPSFRIPKETSWAWDEQSQKQYRRIDKYLSESKTKIEMRPGQKEKEQTVSFHRPLQFYFKLFRSGGFVVSRLEEWISHKKSEEGPRQKEEDRIRKEIPLFMYLEIKKSVSI
jgi:ubiquinone/menaquinone biosynthesis C-methylase UbiE